MCVCSRAQNGFTALHLASCSGNIDCMRALIEAEADCNKLDAVSKGNGMFVFLSVCILGGWVGGWVGFIYLNISICVCMYVCVCACSGWEISVAIQHWPMQ